MRERERTGLLEQYQHLNEEAETSASYGRKLETKVRIYIFIILFPCFPNLEHYKHLNNQLHMAEN
jgi:hypothetical protein